MCNKCNDSYNAQYITLTIANVTICLVASYDI